MKYTDNALNLLTAKSYKGIGNAWIVKNLGHNEDVETIVAMLNKTLKSESTTVRAFEESKKRYESIIATQMEGYCDGFIGLGDDGFPQHRGQVRDGEKPVFLYYRGDISLLQADHANVSVIGLLNPSESIKHREQVMVGHLVGLDAIIVSGLALGCDSIAHEVALDANRRTIAILPSPLTDILPASNMGLADDIVAGGGLLVTEYGSGFRSKMELNTRYRQRDRLQSLFADAVILAASYSRTSGERWGQLKGQKLDSGARLAMGYAQDYGIPRGVMYDEDADASDPMFDLCREILEEDSEVAVIPRPNQLEALRGLLQRRHTSRKLQAMRQSLFD